MLTVGVHEAKTNLSKLLEVVHNGEEVVIAKSGKPVARLVPIENSLKKRVLGLDKGKGFVSDDFDAPLPSDIMKFFS